ncbi:MAG: hypothetical protein IT364_03590 [Candidatus Hydrogenedentes bacterium]|nr:hypothetical protein [Candidatus Hydrogenedentota bacterium]
MAGITSIGGVATGISQVQFETLYQAQALVRQQQAARDVGTAALNLIQAAFSIDPAVGQNLDVYA